ncbi:MAG: YqaA family protein [Candidatus Babeliales bacterium]
MQAFRVMYDWMSAQAHSRYASSILASLFFIEAIIFFPVDPMFVLYCLERRTHAWRYATIAVLSSVAGALASYIIGFALWFYLGNSIMYNRYVQYVMAPATFEHLCIQFQEHAWIALLVAGFSPIPYKAATLVAGFCSVSLVPFIICSIITRGVRFYGVAWLVHRWGQQVKDFIDRFFTILVGLSLLIIIIFILAQLI